MTLTNWKHDVAYWLRARYYLTDKEIERAFSVLDREDWKSLAHLDPHAMARSINALWREAR